MEKITFSSNVEFVAKAKALLEDPEGYPYAYNDEKQTCQYRTEDGRRCIAGRMFYGYVDESQEEFWMASAEIQSLVDYGNRCELNEQFPFLDFSMVRQIQNRHDAAAKGCPEKNGSFIEYGSAGSTWSDIEAMAIKADAIYPRKG